MRAWGHTFLYDEQVLADALTRRGFDPVTRCRYGEPAHAELTDMERHHVGTHRAKADAVRFETMIFEAGSPRV
jgi:hypothetical protein